MVSRIIDKFKYNMTLAIKKPRLILSFIFKRHLGVILLVPIDKRQEKVNLDSDIEIIRSNDVKEIYRYYKRMNRDSVTEKVIRSWLKNGFDCFLVYSSEGITIGGMWIFKEKFTLKNTSGRTLSPHKTIYLNDECIYGAYVIIDGGFRGRGINQLLLRYVIDYYAANNSKYSKLLLITGASNGAYIRTTMKNGAKLIGITEVINICGHKRRKELFLDNKERTWGYDENSFKRS